MSTKFKSHYVLLAEAKLMIGKNASGLKPNTHGDDNRIKGKIVAVRESIADYGSGKIGDILVDLSNGGLVTPCYLESVELIE
jgi:hypothetical protein